MFGQNTKPTSSGSKALERDIDKLKSKIDNFGNGQGPSRTLDLLKLDGYGLKTELIEPFNLVLSDPNFSRCNLDKQLDAIWAYMVMEEYLIHWAGETQPRRLPNGQIMDAANPNGREKLQILQENSGVIYGALNDVIRRINDQGTHQRLRKNFYQKLLHMNANLFKFASKYMQNDKINMQHFNQRILDKAKAIASQPRNSAGSKTETRVNNVIKQTVDSQASLFSMTPKDVYIDEDTSCELDCAFPWDKLAIETDGDHHLVNLGTEQAPRRVHEPVHHFKALALREQGWHRVGLDVRSLHQGVQYGINEAKVQRLAQCFQLQAFADLASSQKALTSAQSSLRQIIAKTRETLSYQNLTAEERAKGETLLGTLYEKDQKVRKIVNQRGLEKILLNVFENNSPTSHKIVKHFSDIEHYRNRMAEIEPVYSNYEKLRDNFFIKSISNDPLAMVYKNILKNLKSMKKYLPTLAKDYEFIPPAGTHVTPWEMRHKNEKYVVELYKAVKGQMAKIKQDGFDTIEAYWNRLDPRKESIHSLESFKVCLHETLSAVNNLLDERHADSMQAMKEATRDLLNEVSMAKEQNIQINEKLQARRPRVNDSHAYRPSTITNRYDDRRSICRHLERDDDRRRAYRDENRYRDDYRGRAPSRDQSHYRDFSPVRSEPRPMSHQAPIKIRT